MFFLGRMQNTELHKTDIFDNNMVGKIYRKQCSTIHDNWRKFCLMNELNNTLKVHMNQ